MSGQMRDVLSASSVVPLEQATGQQPPSSITVDRVGALSGDIKVECQGLGEKGRLDRDRLGWGYSYQPRLDDADGRAKFRRICDDLDAEIQIIKGHVVEDIVGEEASGTVAEIQELLERLYDCPFGEGESLKSAVVVLQSQLNNAKWTTKHVSLLESSINFLRVRRVVNDQTVAEIGEMIEECGLDPFRGTVMDDGFVARYRIEKIEET
jgi:hypothetical protein